MDDMALRELSRFEAGERRDELHNVLDEAPHDSPLIETRTDHLALTRSEFERAARYDGYHSVVAGEGGTIAGFAIGAVGAHDARRPGAVEAAHPGFASGALLVVWVAVRPFRRRQGIARRLLNHLVDVTEVPRVWGYVHPTNAPSRQMLEQRGWHHLGTYRDELVLGRALRATLDG